MLRVTAIGLSVALQCCSRGGVHGRGFVPGPSVGTAVAAAEAAPTPEITSRLPWRRLQHLRHPQSTAPDRPVVGPFGGTLAAAGAPGGGDEGVGNGVHGYVLRRSLSDPEAIVDSTEACASRMEYTLSQCDFLNEQTLEWSYGAGDSALNCEVALPEGVTVNCDHVAWDSGAGLAIEIMAGLGVAISLFFWVALSRYEQSRVLRLDQPSLCRAFVAGIVITFLSVLALLGVSGQLTCALSLWGYSAGFDLAFGALVLKLRHAISTAEHGPIKVAPLSFVSTAKILVALCLVVGGDVAVLTLWTVSLGDSSCGAQYEAVGGGALVRRHSCIDCTQVLLWSWLALKAMLLMLCCYVSVCTRKVQGSNVDSGGIGMTTYNLALTGLPVAAVIWAGANAQVRTTTEAAAIVLGGIGALFSIVGPNVLRAKHELECKALVGPSAGASGDMDEDGCQQPRTSTTSGVSSVGAEGNNNPRGSGRGRRLMSGVDDEAISPSTPSPLTPQEAAAACVTATTAAALKDRAGGSSSRGKGRRLLDQPKRTAPPAASVMCTRFNPGAGGAAGDGAGNFATTGGVKGSRLVMPDPSGFWTPPRHVRGPRSSVEISTRSAGAMVLTAAAAAAAAEQTRSGGRAGESLSGSRSGSSSHRTRSRDSGSGGRGPAEANDSNASLSGLGVDDRQHSGGGSGSISAKPPLKPASESKTKESRARRSQGKSRGRNPQPVNPNPRRTSSHRSVRSTSSLGGDSNSARSSRDSWANDPIIMAINGYPWGPGGQRQTSGGGGGNGSNYKKRKTSFIGAGRQGSGMWSNGVRRRGKSNERERSPSTAGGGRRSSAAGSLVMHINTGTRLFCPHCDKEVAGCGFKGCSGSLVRKPSFSDDEYGPELFVAPPVPPPLLPPLVPAVFGGYSSGLPGMGGGSLGLGAGGAGGISSAPGSLLGEQEGGKAQGANMHSPSTQKSGSVRSSSHVHAAPAHGGGTHRTLSLGATSRVRMSFLRGPAPCDTFDNESDSGRDYDEDEDESQRSNLGIFSPTSSSAWG